MNKQQLRNNIRNKLNANKIQLDDSIKRNNKWTKYYGSSDWKYLRLWKINTQPLCENCLHYGIVTPAEHVHHVIPFGTGQTELDKWRLLLDPSNVMSVCSSCHELFHKTMRLYNTTNIERYIEPETLKAERL